LVIDPYIKLQIGNQHRARKKETPADFIAPARTPNLYPGAGCLPVNGHNTAAGNTSGPPRCDIAYLI